MKIKIKKINPYNIFHVICSDHIDLSQSFCRLQEFYESSNKKFREKFFYWEEYIDWYARKFGQGDFTYLSDWEGFNIPGHLIEKFNSLFANDYTKKENALITLIFKTLKKYKLEKTDKFYIIGSLSNSFNVFEHELRHGLFYLINGYRNRILKILKKYKKQVKKLHQKLETMGYNKKVLNDEVQAYVLTGACPLGYSKNISEWPKWLQKIRKDLKTVEKQFIEK